MSNCAKERRYLLGWMLLDLEEDFPPRANCLHLFKFSNVKLCKGKKGICWVGCCSISWRIFAVRAARETKALSITDGSAPHTAPLFFSREKWGKCEIKTAKKNEENVSQKTTKAKWQHTTHCATLFLKRKMRKMWDKNCKKNEENVSKKITKDKWEKNEGNVRQKNSTRKVNSCSLSESSLKVNSRCQCISESWRLIFDCWAFSLRVQLASFRSKFLNDALDG